jgi:DNA-binding transcriptional regulator YiaG
VDFRAGLLRIIADRVSRGAAVQVIASWTGGQADALRQALRMTNESFADHLSVAVRTVAYWRKRPEIIPQPQMQEILDAALASAIHTKVESSLIMWLSCGNTLKSPQGARTFWVRVTSSVSAGHT